MRAKKSCFTVWKFLLFACCVVYPRLAAGLGGGDGAPARHGVAVKKGDRSAVMSTENGEISAVNVSDGRGRGAQRLEFITMETNALLLPLHLHSDMVFYVTSGSGTLSYTDVDKDNGKLRRVDLRKGDIYRLPPGTFFYLQSNLDSGRRKLRISAFFSDPKNELLEESSVGAYASVRDLMLGFDNRVLQAAFGVPAQVIKELKGGKRPPLIVHGASEANNSWFNIHSRIMRAFLGNPNRIIFDVNKNKKEKAYNILKAKHDVDNCNGWSVAVTEKQWDSLKGSDLGVFMVNLTKGAMMGPHWNPTAGEIAVVLRGRGMVHVVCPSVGSGTECKNSRFRVEEGDVFVVPRYHPMAQISFNNESFVFVGFTTTSKRNHPQYLTGKASVFQTLDKWVWAEAFNVSNTTVDQVLSAQSESIILECTSCAEEEEKLMEEEEEGGGGGGQDEEARRRQEEERREQEAARKREEEEARRQEEEARRREEEEAQEAAREAAEEERREQEAARKREEEEARRREEEKRRKEQEEEARRREEEAAEEERREQEEAREREEEEARRMEDEKRRREQEEEAREREEEERQAAEEERREQEEVRKREEEVARGREDEKRRKEEEEEARRQAEEEAARRQAEEEARRQAEEEAAARQQQEEEEAARHWAEEAAKQQRKEEKAARRRQEEAARRRQAEEEAARRQQEEAARRQQAEEEAARHQAEEEARQQQEATTGRN